MVGCACRPPLAEQRFCFFEVEAGSEYSTSSMTALTGDCATASWRDAWIVNRSSSPPISNIVAGLLQIAVAPLLQRLRALLPSEIAGLVVAILGFALASIGVRYSLGISNGEAIKPTYVIIASLSVERIRQDVLRINWHIYRICHERCLWHIGSVY